jgi:hypothetical protein
MSDSSVKKLADSKSCIADSGVSSAERSLSECTGRGQGAKTACEEVEWRLTRIAG